MDYKQQTINEIREVHDFDISDAKLEYLYHMWSENTCAASWVMPTAKDITRFCKWANTTPLQEVVAMSESDFE